MLHYFMFISYYQTDIICACSDCCVNCIIYQTFSLDRVNHFRKI